MRAPPFAPPDPLPPPGAPLSGGSAGCRSVELVDHCEIDPRVCEVSLQFLPTIASALGDARVNTLYRDGAAWLANHTDYYDAVIVDSSDPVGPAATLFETSFYKTAQASLRAGGILCTQAECLWNNLELISELYSECSPLFTQCQYAYTTIPTYPSGQIGFMVCTDGAHPVNKPVRSLSPPQLCQAAALQGWTGPAVCARCGRTRLRRSCATTAARSTGLPSCASPAPNARDTQLELTFGPLQAAQIRGRCAREAQP